MRGSDLLPPLSHQVDATTHSEHVPSNGRSQGKHQNPLCPAGRHLRVIWTPDVHCQAGFHDLFENKEDVWDTFDESEISGANFVTYNYMNLTEKYTYIDDGPYHIYIQSAYLLNSTIGFEVRTR